MKSNCLYCYRPLTNGEKEFHFKCADTFFGTPVPPIMEYTLDQMEELARNVVERSVAVPGVQPKLSMSLLKQAHDKNAERLTVVGMLGGLYIFKPPVHNFPEMPANEHLSMRLAEMFGMRVVPSSLIKLASGELSYITKRVDRLGNGAKIHMIDMFQATEAFDKYRSSMERVGKAIGEYSKNTQLDKLFFFELALFSFLTGNNDMHLKNFSLIESENGWQLAPAYDLLNVAIVMPDDSEELALTLCGKKRKLQKTHFDQLGESLGLTTKQIKGAYGRMVKKKQSAFNLIEQSFLSNAMQKAYINVMTERYDRIGLGTSTSSRR